MNIKKITPWIKVLCALLLISAGLHAGFSLSPSFADGFNLHVSHYPRFILSKITGILPFSLAEILLFSILPVAVAVAIRLIRSNKSTKESILFLLKLLFSFLGIIYILFVLTFAAGYKAETVDLRLGIEKEKLEAEEIYTALSYAVDKTNSAVDSVSYTESGASEMPFEINELSAILSASYEKFFREYDLGKSFDSKVKPLIISPIMTYTHISGVYSFFTGEANLNTNFPDYVCVFSAAHEMAHQRGFAREDEANFMAFLICTESDNEYVQYAGWLSVYNYLAPALRQANYDLFYDAASKLSEKATDELIAYNRFFDKYRNSAASKVSDKVNDTYLKVQGTEGLRSYGLVTDLAVAYINNLSDN